MMIGIRNGLVGLLVIGLVACQGGGQEPLTIAINDWTGYQPLSYAKQLGYLDNQTVHLANLGSTTETLQKFRAGIVDAACVTLDEAMQLDAEGYDISVILVMDISNGADAIVAKPYVHNLSDLRHTHIGVENTALGAYVLARALDKAQLSVSDISTLPINASEQVSSFKQKNVDAVVSFQPEKAQLIEMGGHVIFDSSMIPNEIVDVLVVRNSKIKKYYENIETTIGAWFHTLADIQKDHQKFHDWLTQQQDVDPASVRNALNEIIFPDKNQNIQMLRKDGQINKIVMKMSQIMIKKQLITKRPDTDQLISDQFVKG